MMISYNPKAKFKIESPKILLNIEETNGAELLLTANPTKY